MIKAILSLIACCALINMSSCCVSFKRLKEEKDKCYNLAFQYQDKLTAMVLPRIEEIDTLICLYGKLSGSSDVVNIAQAVLEFCDSSFIGSLQACLSLSGKKLKLMKEVQYPYIVLSIEIEGNDLLLDIGIMNAELAGHGAIYKLIPKKGIFILGPEKGLWIS